MRAVSVGIGNGHHNGKSGPVRCAREPFMAVDDIIAAILHRPGVHQDGIRAGKLGFGHGKATPSFTANQRLQPGLFLLGSGMLDENFRVANVRRLTIE